MQMILKVIRSYTFRATPPTNLLKCINFVYVPIRSFATVVNSNWVLKRSPQQHPRTPTNQVLNVLSLWGARGLMLAYIPIYSVRTVTNLHSVEELKWRTRNGPPSLTMVSITFRHVPAHVPLRSGTASHFWFWAGPAKASSEYAVLRYVPSRSWTTLHT